MRTFRTITKEELIDALEDLPDDAKVAFVSDYGDIVHTQQVHSLRGSLEESELYETAYSVSGYAVQEAAEYREDEKSERVWVLS